MVNGGCRRPVGRLAHRAVAVVAATLSCVAAASGGIPAGYTQVEYIKGDGTTSDVATDFIPHPQTDKIVLELELTDTSKNMFAFCARKAAATQAWSVNLMGGGTAKDAGFRLDYRGNCKTR